MATNRKSLAPALLFFTCVIFNIISMISLSVKWGNPFNFRNIILSMIIPLALAVVCFIDTKSKALPPLYLVFSLAIIVLGNIFLNFALANTSIYVAVIYLLLFALTFLSRSFRTSNAGLICKLLLLLLAVIVIIITIARIRYMFMEYFNPAHLCNCILSINAVYLLLKN